MKQIRVDIEKCSGCGQCALTCSFKNVGKFELSQSNIRIIQWEDICLSVPNLCQQCCDAPCVVSCPTEAISVNPNTGAIVIDTELCTQCYNCIEECRYQVIHVDLEGYPLTCDLCGGSPKCVAVCFPGALSFVEIPEIEKEPLKALAHVLIDRRDWKTCSFTGGFEFQECQMSGKPLVIHTEIRATKGARINDLSVNPDHRSLYDVLVLMSQQEWAWELFTEKDGRVTPVAGYMMVLGSKMVQQWEVDDTFVNDGQNLKFVQVVPGG